MKDNFYAIRSKEGTAVIDIDSGCVQVFETWEHAVSSPKRKTDEIVAVTIKRVDREKCSSDVGTMIKALRVLSKDIQSGDGVANACVSDAADMIERIDEQLAKANECVKRLELIAKGLCYTEGTVRGDKAYADWCEYQEQLRKDQNQC